MLTRALALALATSLLAVAPGARPAREVTDLDDVLGSLPVPPLVELLEDLGPAPDLAELLTQLPDDVLPLLRLPVPDGVVDLSAEVKAAADAGDLARVESTSEELLQLLNEALPDEHPRLVDARVLRDEGIALAELPPADRAAVIAAREADDELGLLYRAGRLREACDLVVDAVAQRQAAAAGEADRGTIELLGNLTIFLYQTGDPTRAESLARAVVHACLTRFGRVHPATETAISNLAYFLTARRAFREAEALHAHALELQRLLTGDSDLDFARCLFNLAQLYRDSDRLADARDLFERVLAVREAEGATPLETGTALAQIGYVRMRLGDADGARKALREGLGRFDAAGLPDHHERAQALEHLSFVERSLGRLDEAITLGEQSVDMYARLFPDGHPYRGHGALALAKTLERYGRLDDAEARVREALASFEATLPTTHPYRLESLVALGSVLTERGALREAREVLTASLAGRRAVFGERAQVVADDLADLAQIEHALGETEAALEHVHEECAILRDRLGATHTRTNKADFRRARILLESGRLGEARTVRDAIADAGSVDPPAVARRLLFDGRLALAEGDRGAAIHALRASVAASPGQVESLYRLGAALLDGGESAEASETLERALTLCESRRGRILGDERARALYAARLSMDEIARTLVRAYVRAGDPSAALFAAERGRNRALLDLLHRSGRTLAAGDEELSALFEREERARVAEVEAVQELRRVRSRAAATAAEVDLGLAAVTATRAALESVRRDLAGEIGRLWPGAAVASPRAILERLAPDEVLLHYTVDDLGVVLLLGRRDEPLRAYELDSLADELCADLSPSPLAALSRKLLPADVVAELRAAARVVLVLDGPLHGVPFEALSLGGEPWSAAGPACIYRPSASLTVASVASKAARRAVLLGDPAYAASAGSTPVVESRDGREFTDLDAFRLFGAQLRPLPGSRAEIERVGAWLGSAGFGLTVLKGDDASEARLEDAARGARVLHLATHGFRATDARPYDAALALAAPGGDGFLTLDELVRRWGDLLPGCELVTLSACESQVGAEQGTSLVSLPWGFFHAGARRVLVSLWKVDDRATALLMDRFYANWMGGTEEDREVGGRRYERGRAMPIEDALLEARAWLASRTPAQNRAHLARLGLAEEAAEERGQDVAFPLPGSDPTSRASTNRFDFSHPRHWAAFVLYEAG